MALKQIFKRKNQTAVKGRSSALIITIAIHAILLLIAGTFVAVTVVQRSEAKFEGKQIVRPKMKLKKLQVPVKIEKQVKQAPKLNQRVTVVNRINTKAVDFKMPEIGGFGGGGVGVDMSGVSLAGSLGFASTQLNVFGLKSSGEKIVFILDTSSNMLVDEIGGIPAYKIIKDELIGLIGRLPPTALINVVVFESGWRASAYSSELVPASYTNIQKIAAWLAPLNNNKNNVGVGTLASPGVSLSFEPMPQIPNNQNGWAAGLSYALQKGADNVYWLGSSDYLNPIHKAYYEDVKRGKPLPEPSGIPPEFKGYDYEALGGKEKWDARVAEARKKHDEENARRQAAKQPIRVITDGGSDRGLVQTYFPGALLPRFKFDGVGYLYSAQDIMGYIRAMQQKYSSQDRRLAAIGLGEKPFSFNVIHFVPKGNRFSSLGQIDMVARRMNGGYLRIEGMDAIKSSATAPKKE